MTDIRIIKALVLYLQTLDNVKDHDSMMDTALALQAFLIDHGYLSKDIRKTSKYGRYGLIDSIIDIFLFVRNEYQDYKEPCTDFSDILLAQTIAKHIRP